MSIFHRHGDADDERHTEVDGYEVLDADGHAVWHARDEFDMIVETTDPDEVRRQVDLGWVVLDEREVDGPGRGPSGEDLIPGIEGLRVGGVLGYEAGASVTQYTIGFLREDAPGTSQT